MNDESHSFCTMKHKVDRDVEIGTKRLEWSGLNSL